MKLLNLGCGATRPQSPEWINTDDLHAEFIRQGHVADAARANLDRESNYINHDVLSGPFPFQDSEFEGIVASHFFEHFTAQDGVKIMKDCQRILKRGGILIASVPNASYFREVYPEDTKPNGMKLFGEQMNEANPNTSFFSAALWFCEHMVILTEDSLWCYFVRSGFHPSNIHLGIGEATGSPASHKLSEALNRPQYSLIMTAMKDAP